MKITISFFLLFLSTLSFAQSWTKEEKAVLTKYNLSENDHRGVIFTKGKKCDINFENTVDALIDFFQPTVRQDLIYFCIQGDIKLEYLDKPLGIKELIRIYIEQKDSKH